MSDLILQAANKDPDNYSKDTLKQVGVDRVLRVLQ
jgi:hypothetical protein